MTASYPSTTSAEAKNLVRGCISYLEAEGLPVNKSSIFRHFGVSRSQGYAALSLASSKRNDPDWEETRGRPSKISQDDQQKMEEVLWSENFEDKPLNWTSLAEHAGISMSCNSRTMHRALGSLGYRRCLSCGRCITHKKLRERRVEYARRMLESLSQPQDWRFVRFSGELHFGLSTDGKMRVIPRAGEKNCPNCDQDPEKVWQRDARRLHAWAAVGFGFKSELVFYDESTSSNNAGMLTMTTYRDKILEPHVKPWLGNGNASNFVLEEDIDVFAHGGLSKVNEVQEWKRAHGIRYHFNCGDSPDLSPLDSLWPPMKQWEVSQPIDWTDKALKQAAKDAWANLDQNAIDMWVDAMQQRLASVVRTEGRLVNW